MSVHRIAKGLDIPLAGAPEGDLEVAAAPELVGWVAADFVGVKPALRVNVGDRVVRGSPLVEDKRTGVCHTSPAAGVVAAVHRGERRALQSIVIAVDPDDDPTLQVAFANFSGADPTALSSGDIRALLLESGTWTALRTRPYPGYRRRMGRRMPCSSRRSTPVRMPPKSMPCSCREPAISRPASSRCPNSVRARPMYVWLPDRVLSSPWATGLLGKNFRGLIPPAPLACTLSGSTPWARAGPRGTSDIRTWPRLAGCCRQGSWMSNA